MINSIKAEDIFDNNSTTEDVVDDEYQTGNDDIETVDDEEEKMDNIQELGDQIEGKNNSFGVVLIEIFCGVVGLFMLFLAFRANDN